MNKHNQICIKVARNFLLNKMGIIVS